MKPILMFLPNPISPKSVDGPSANTEPISTFSPLSTIGLWFMHVPGLDLLNLRSL